MLRIFGVAVFAWMLLVPAGVSAHGTDYRIVDKKAVVMEFFYSDKKPMQYSEVLIFSPENDTIEYQNGRTDQSGRFAFFPELAGEWQVKVNDGVGHAVSAVVTVAPDCSGGRSAEQTGDVPQKQAAMLDGIPKIIKLIFGVSLLVNFYLGLSVWKRKFSKSPPLK